METRSNKSKKIKKSKNQVEVKRLKSLSDSYATTLYGYQKELKTLNKIVDDSLIKKESNSVLIIGDSGCGKSVLVESCFAQISANQNLVIIRLNGLIYENDLITIKYIAQHFDIEVTDMSQIWKQIENLCHSKNLCLIFILDNFDLFCRRNQILLYNLLDLSHHLSSICIIGMTKRLDCLELLEKRVKSRMNQRIIHLLSPFKDFEDYLNFAKQLINVKNSALLKDSLKIQYSLNKSVRDLKIYLLNYATNEKVEHLRSKDTKFKSLFSLSNYELLVLSIAIQKTITSNSLSFNCASIMDELLCNKKIKDHKIDVNTLFKIIYNLMDYGLIIKHSFKKIDSMISEWTHFELNVDVMHIKDYLQKNEQSLPDYFKTFNFNQ